MPSEKIFVSMALSPPRCLRVLCMLVTQVICTMLAHLGFSGTVFLCLIPSHRDQCMSCLGLLTAWWAGTWISIPRHWKQKLSIFKDIGWKNWQSITFTIFYWSKQSQSLPRFKGTKNRPHSSMRRVSKKSVTVFNLPCSTIANYFQSITN